VPAAAGHLVIEHAERPVAQDGRGPLRAEQVPRLAVRPDPAEVVLAEVVLAADGAVARLAPGARVAAGLTLPPPTVPLAVEGERDVNPGNPETVVAHVRGGVPVSAVLHLRSERFSLLHYTELGRHDHRLVVTITDHTAALEHSHPIGAGAATSAGGHRHALLIEDGGNANSLQEYTGGNVGWGETTIGRAGRHTHVLAGETEYALGDLPPHDHQGTAAPHRDEVTAAAVAEDRTRDGEPYGFPHDLRVRIDGTDVTDRVLAQLRDRDGPDLWPSLGTGTGTAGDTLATTGTGEIDLIALGVDLSPGEHRIVLGVPSGGGCVGYNLYLE
jgi:hypothetical protein